MNDLDVQIFRNFMVQINLFKGPSIQVTWKLLIIDRWLVIAELK